MKVAIPQLNYRTGKIQENATIILNAIKKAQKEKAELVVFPEMAICGAFPQDLLEKEYFIDECRLAIEKIALQCNNIAVIIGGPNLDANNGIMYNSAYFILNGEVVDGVHKTILSDYDLFDESRYFIAGEDNTAIRYKNQNIRILFDEYEADYIERTDSFVIHLGVAPFTTESLSYRLETWNTLARKYAKPILSVNQWGGNTSVIFDGNSFICSAKGNTVCKLNDFAEDFTVTETNQTGNMPVLKKEKEDKIQLIHKALLTGIRDYFSKNGFSKAIIGLSGGIDSAVVAALTAEAIGSENVTGILMPSKYSTDHSVQDALDLAKNLGMPHEIIPIKEIYDQFLHSLQPQFKELPFNVAEENLQARIRGSLVMAMSNKFGYILLNTSNKSEAAVGYGTLYGDLCGSLSVIGDIYKTDVFKLARYINRSKTIIPENTITKAPSAELRPDQKDQDSLPEYNVLDSILELYLEENLPKEAILAKGFDKTIVEKTISLVECNEYKRAQCPPNLKVSKKAFGKGRRMPF